MPNKIYEIPQSQEAVDLAAYDVLRSFLKENKDDMMYADYLRNPPLTQGGSQSFRLGPAALDSAILDDSALPQSEKDNLDLFNVLPYAVSPQDTFSEALSQVLPSVDPKIFTLITKNQMQGRGIANDVAFTRLDSTFLPGQSFMERGFYQDFSVNEDNSVTVRDLSLQYIPIWIHEGGEDYTLGPDVTFLEESSYTYAWIAVDEAIEQCERLLSWLNNHKGHSANNQKEMNDMKAYLNSRLKELKEPPLGNYLYRKNGEKVETLFTKDHTRKIYMACDEKQKKRISNHRLGSLTSLSPSTRGVSSFHLHIKFILQSLDRINHSKYEKPHKTKLATALLQNFFIAIKTGNIAAKKREDKDFAQLDDIKGDTHSTAKNNFQQSKKSLLDEVKAGAYEDLTTLQQGFLQLGVQHEKVGEAFQDILAIIQDNAREDDSKASYALGLAGVLICGASPLLPMVFPVTILPFVALGVGVGAIVGAGAINPTMKEWFISPSMPVNPPSGNLSASELKTGDRSDSPTTVADPLYNDQSPDNTPRAGGG